MQKKNLITFLKFYLDNENIPGFHWIDRDKQIWHLPWKIHKATTWGDPDATVLYAWAQYKYDYVGSEPSKKELRKWKENVRNAIGTNSNIKELNDFHKQDSVQPYKVYQFINEKPTEALASSCMGVTPDLQLKFDNCNIQANEEVLFNDNLPNFSILTATCATQQSSPVNEGTALFKNCLSMSCSKSFQTASDALGKPKFSSEVPEVKSFTSVREEGNNEDFHSNSALLAENATLNGGSTSPYNKGRLFDSHFTASEQTQDAFQMFSTSYYPKGEGHLKAQTEDVWLPPDLRSRSPIRQNSSEISLTEEAYKNSKPENLQREMTYNNDLGSNGVQNLPFDVTGIYVSAPSIVNDCHDLNLQPSEHFLPDPFDSSTSLGQRENDASSKVSPSFIEKCAYDDQERASFWVSISYSSKRVLHTQTQEKVKLCFVKNDSQRDSIIQCPTPAQFGPSDAVLIELPHPNNLTCLNLKEKGRVSKILEKMQRGITMAYLNGDIFATRYCKAVVYYYPERSDPVKLERGEPVKVFDFQEHFRPQFYNGQWSLLKYSVKLSFGIKPEEKLEVVTLCITHTEARNMLMERADHERKASLEPDCSLSNEFDKRLDIEQELRDACSSL